jgi:hypothetical protein
MNIGKNVGARSTISKGADGATRDKRPAKPAKSRLTGGSSNAVVTPGKK